MCVYRKPLEEETFAVGVYVDDLLANSTNSIPVDKFLVGLKDLGGEEILEDAHLLCA